MLEKHDRTAESHAGVPGQIKKNFFLLLHTQDGGGVTLCMRNTIEQLNHTLGFLDRSRRIFFLLLHTQDGGSYIMPLKHDRTAESHTGVYGGKKKNFFSSYTYT